MGLSYLPVALSQKKKNGAVNRDVEHYETTILYTGMYVIPSTYWYDMSKTPHYKSVHDYKKIQDINLAQTNCAKRILYHHF